MSCGVSRHEPLKVQNSAGKSARIFQRSTDLAITYTRCSTQFFIRLTSYQSFQGFVLLYYLNQIPLKAQMNCHLCFLE